MPRTKRIKSNTNVYHIISRSLNRELLFEVDSDYIKYLSLLSEAKEKFNVKIYAYCLMTNHIHLIIYSLENNFSQMMKWLNSNYALYFNAKYGRLGYVFANRFNSEPIETIEYLWCCIRYIHQNPIKARICNNISDYKFSSIHAYKNEASNYLKIVDAFAVLKRFGFKDFVKWNEIENHDLCMDYACNHYSDEELRKILFEFLNIDSVKAYDKLDEAHKAYGILKLIDMYVPLRQISRVTGLYYGKLQKMRRGVEGKVSGMTFVKS